MTFSSPNVKKFLFEVSFDDPLNNVRKKDKTESDKLLDNKDVETISNKPKDVPAEKKVEVKSSVPPPPPPPKEPSFTQKELDEASKTSFALGEAAGIKKNSQSVASLQAKAFEHIVESLKKMQIEQQKNNEENLKKALLLATEITKKIIPNITAKYGTEEIEALIKKYLPQINKEKIIIKVNKEQKHSVDMKIYELAKNAGFEGVINIVEDQSVLAGDCHIFWDNGEVIKNTQKVLKDIDSILEQNINIAPKEENEKI